MAYLETCNGGRDCLQPTELNPNFSIHENPDFSKDGSLSQSSLILMEDDCDGLPLLRGQLLHRCQLPEPLPLGLHLVSPPIHGPCLACLKLRV